jgi:hypothetical protein
MNNEEEQFIHSDSRKINTDPQEQQAYESRSINSDMREQPWLREEFPQNGEKLPQKPSRHIPRSYIIGLIIVAVILALIGSTLIYTHSVVKVIASTPSKTPTQGSTVTPTQGSTVTSTQGSTVKPTLRPTATPIPRPTATPSLTVIPSPGTFGFENGSQNWGTSEGNFKLAKVDVTTNLVHSGIHSLQVTTTLL